MKKLLSATALAALAVVPAAQPVQAQDETLAELLGLDDLTRTLIEVGVLFVRTQVDVTYEGLSVTGGGSGISITGLTFYPEAPFDDMGTCEVRIERIDLTAGGIAGVSETHIEVLGTSVNPACLPPDVGEVLAATGYDAPTIDRMFITMHYEIGSSELTAQAHLAVADAAVIDVAVDFDYFWFREGRYGDPEPAMLFSGATVTIEDMGMLERVLPIVPPREFNPANAPMMVEQGLEGLFTDFGRFDMPADAATLIAEAAGAVDAFLNGGAGKISLTFAPEAPIWLDDSLEDRYDGPADLLIDMKPSVTSGPAAGLVAIDAALVRAAVEGGAVDAADAKAVGMALLTGMGAPKAPGVAVDVLAQIAETDGEVAMALAEALMETEEEAAYRFAQSAAALGEPGAVAMLDAIEEELELETILALQPEGDRSMAEGSVSELRAAALAAASGIGAERSYVTAYALASLAAASGDLSSAALRDQVSAKLSAMDDEVWAGIAEEVDGAVLEVWLSMQ